MQLAVIKTGGKQYVVTRGQKIRVEKLPYDAGAEFDFDEVLLLVYAGSVKVGTPFVAGAKVHGKVAGHEKGEKVVVFKFKAKKRERRRKGHRQNWTIVEILDIKDAGVKTEKTSEEGEKPVTVRPKAPQVARRTAAPRKAAK